MREYIFFIYRQQELMWQMCLPSADPDVDKEKLLEAYNVENEWADEEKADAITYCTLDQCMASLKHRGKLYYHVEGLTLNEPTKKPIVVKPIVKIAIIIAIAVAVLLVLSV